MMKILTYFPIALTIHRYGRSLNAFRYVFREPVIIFPAIILISYLSFLGLMERYVILFLILYSIYEIFYIYNDVYAIKYSDKPLKRLYTKDLKPKVAIMIRTICIFILTYLYFTLFSVGYNLFIAIGLISVFGCVHNLHRTKSNSFPTLFAMKISKYLFIPIALDYNCYPFIVLLLPILFLDGVEMGTELQKRYGFNCIEIGNPYWHWLIIFLPIQVFLLWGYSPLIFLGTIAFSLVSMVRHI